MERYRTISVTPRIHEMIKKMRHPGQTIGGAIEEAIINKQKEVKQITKVQENVDYQEFLTFIDEFKQKLKKRK